MPPQILILDGGLGTSLEDKYAVSFSRATPLWSSDLLVSDQPTLLACQRDFGDAPVDVLLTATYQASIDGFAATSCPPEFPQGVAAASIPMFLDAALKIAERAVRPGARVALSIGPYGACMIPSQEYSGSYDAEHNDGDALGAWHRERLQLFADIPDVGARAAYVALETVPRVDEIIAMRRALAATPQLAALPYWVSCLSPEEHMVLPDGSSIETAVEAMLSPDQSARAPWGVGINCTKVHKLDAMLRAYETVITRMIQDERLSAWPALVLYPDGTNGEVYNTTTQKWEYPEGSQTQGRISWEDQLSDVVTATASRGEWPTIVVGGCCRASSNDIRRLREQLVR